MLTSISSIEDRMADIMSEPKYPQVVEEYERLLKIMGNVDGAEVIALVLVAFGEMQAKN